MTYTVLGGALNSTQSNPVVPWGNEFDVRTIINDHFSAAVSSNNWITLLFVCFASELPFLAIKHLTAFTVY